MVGCRSDLGQMVAGGTGLRHAQAGERRIGGTLVDLLHVEEGLAVPHQVQGLLHGSLLIVSAVLVTIIGGAGA